MPTCPPRPHGSSPSFRRGRRLWRALLAVLFPAVLLAQSTTVFKLPIGRAGDTFTLKRFAAPPSTGFDSTPLTLEITDPLEDGTPSASSRLFLSTTQPLAYDYFITDESAGDSTSPNRLGTATFFRRSFLALHVVDGERAGGRIIHVQDDEVMVPPAGGNLQVRDTPTGIRVLRIVRGRGWNSKRSG
jgi:hypothetical protein